MSSGRKLPPLMNGPGGETAGNEVACKERAEGSATPYIMLQGKSPASPLVA